MTKLASASAARGGAVQKRLHHRLVPEDCAGVTVIMMILLAAANSGAFGPSLAARTPVIKDNARSVINMGLEPFLEKAGVSPKFVAKVVELLDDEVRAANHDCRSTAHLPVHVKTALHSRARRRVTDDWRRGCPENGE